MRARLILAALLSLGLMAAASDPSERLADPAQEAHARRLFQQIRCVVCQNESIDDSEAGLAHDLRAIVRDQVRAGRSDADIKRFLVARYGQFILLRPSFSAENAALWLLPFAVLAAGGVYLVLRARSPRPPETPLSDRETEALAALTRPVGERHGFAPTPLQVNRDDQSTDD
ncbi:MAG TPA: cytochrome c-type biogenesis protein [Caulobacteraceae bacterium]|nr:cytochrome c-type biogenesis protein [Caulobacteraceae bacterium]